MRYANLFLIILIAIAFAFANTEKPDGNNISFELPEFTATSYEVMADEDDKESDSKPDSKFEFKNDIFDAPVMLMAGKEPMKAGHSYPSPVIFDIDNDGDAEMVLGEIMGTVSYCENENKSAGDPVWSKVMPVKKADGKPLKLHNW